MAVLELTLFGPFEAKLEERPLTKFRINKAKALLIFLAVENNQGGTNRERLMTLLWPGMPQKSAQQNLRQTIYYLRQAVKEVAGEENTEDFLLSDNESVAINPAYDWQADVHIFTRRLYQVRSHEHSDLFTCSECRSWLEEAVQLYNGDFLNDFYLADSSEFEDWAAANRQAFRQRMLDALDNLAAIYLQGEYHHQAQTIAHRHLKIDELDERAHRHLMEAMARNGQRNEALAQYERLKRLLQDELVLEPVVQTVSLYERIKSGEVGVVATKEKGIHGFELREKIGEGAFGQVYRAYQPSVGRDVAIKRIAPSYASQPEFARRFEVEAQIVARLEHPHIVPLYDYWQEEEGAFLVMRWLRGGSLHDSLAKGPWKMEPTIHLLDQISAALTAAHNQSIIHRDIKPANILLDEEGNAYLTDFGIAKDLAALRQETVAGELVGTPEYFSPEQIRSEPVTPASDIYGLGIVLYEILAGEHPYAGSALVGLIHQQLNEPIPDLHHRRPGIPEAVYHVLRRATAKDPAGRYQSPLELAAAFREASGSGRMVSLRSNVSTTPEFPKPSDAVPSLPESPFTAREWELAYLSRLAEKMLDRKGQLQFVIGEAGMGKTRLLQVFAQELASHQPDLLIAFGTCSVGNDPYLPFRQVLTALIGGVESQWRAGVLTHNQASRLWQAAPLVMELVATQGPELIGTLLPVDYFREQMDTFLVEKTPTRERLETLVALAQNRSQKDSPHYFIEQYVNVLLALSEQHPLVIILDDLQWIDAASAELLFNLGRMLPAGRLLLLGAYRPDEMAVHTSHPLQKVLDELQLSFGDICLNLDEIPVTKRQLFVNAYLDNEPNDLDEQFRITLCDHTEGNPLMTIETLRNLQARGYLVRNSEGRWVVGEGLVWDELPSRIEGAIQERIGRLEQPLREILSAASVEGEVFTVQVLARLMDQPERSLIHRLNRDLDKKHRLVSEVGVYQVNNQRLYQYRFRHSVFQQFFYRNLGEIEREIRHLEVGEALENLYSIEEAAPRLAWHFSHGQEPEKALQYLILAGDQARDQYAPLDALGHYQQAIKLARENGQNRIAAQTLMKLGLVHHMNFDFDEARQAFEASFVLWQQIGPGLTGAGSQKQTEVLRLDWLRPVTLDPALAADTFTGSLIHQLFSGLVELTPKLAIVPAVAERLDVGQDGRKYTFHLRPDWRWHDGQPVVAADFIYAWRRILSPETNSPHAHILYPIRGAKAYHQGEETNPNSLGLSSPNDQTFVVELIRPVSTFLHLLATWPTFPVPGHIIKAQGKDWVKPSNLVGNGPFQLTSTLDPNSITLMSSPLFTGKRAGNIRQISIGLVEKWDDSWPQRLSNYRSGAVDGLYLHGAPLEVLKQIQTEYINEYITTPHFGVGYMIFDVTQPPFDDSRVRKAMAMVINRQTLADVILAGYEYPADGGFIPPGMPGHSPDIGLDHNPEEASRLLAEAGFPGGTGFPAIRIFHMRPAYEVDYLKTQWETILGLTLEWASADWETMMARLSDRRPHVIISNATVSYPDPVSLLRWQPFADQMGILSSPRLNEQLEEAIAMTDQTARIALFSMADRLIIEQAAVVPLTYLRNHFLLSPRIKHFPVSPLRWWYWSDVVVNPV